MSDLTNSTHPTDPLAPIELRPDYQGGGILNLMATLIHARGGESPWPEATLLPAAALGNRRHLVLLIVDGLGADWLARQAPTGLLARHRIGTLTSVFPTTTAAAIGTFLTGMPPARHGIVGWFTWLRELGMVMKVLPGEPRGGGQRDWGMVADLRRLFPCAPVFDRIATRSTLIAPEWIANSAFNRAHRGRSQLRTYRHLRAYFRQIEEAVRRVAQPSLIYAYWPELDHIGHEQGIESAAAIAHLAAFEAGLAELARRLAGQSVELLITADHGLVDTTPADQIDLARLPALAERLRLPLCGEPRAAFCYTAGDERGAFMAMAREQLGERFAVVASEDLLAGGFFGPGQAFSELRHRIGDVTLLGRDHHIIRDRLGNEKDYTPIGVHGGLSRAELHVPLCRIRPQD